MFIFVMGFNIAIEVGSLFYYDCGRDSKRFIVEILLDRMNAHHHETSVVD